LAKVISPEKPSLELLRPSVAIDFLYFLWIDCEFDVSVTGTEDRATIAN